MSVKQNNALLLPRILALKDVSPFILVIDSLAQSAQFFFDEFLHRVPPHTHITFISFESIDHPARADVVVSGHGKTLQQVLSHVKESASGKQSSLVCVDNLSYIPMDQLSQFLLGLMSTKSIVSAVYHGEIEDATLSSCYSYHPQFISLLKYFATTLVRVEPLKDQDDETRRQFASFTFSPFYNQSKFKANVLHKRKSGRGMSADYHIDFTNHDIEFVPPKINSVRDEQDISALQGLSTFNLGTTSVQKLAKENVELPYFGAQEYGEGGAQGGAIIYEFEKDDDYDEEDPYEDPF